jgi:hypothetical protein
MIFRLPSEAAFGHAALRQTNPRRQGDIGEAAAIAWLTDARSKPL